MRPSIPRMTLLQKLTLFDLDGTLVDSETLLNEVLVDFLAELGFDLSVEEADVRFRGGKMAESVSQLEKRFNTTLQDDFIPLFRARTAEAFSDRLQPIDGALDLVSSLDTNMCIASNGPPEKINLSLTLTGLKPYFEEKIFSAYDINAWKPNPELFLNAAKSLGAKPENCAVVEDSLPGIRGGLAAGMRVYGLFPYAPPKDLPSEVVVVQHLSELKELL